MSFSFIVHLPGAKDFTKVIHSSASLLFPHHVPHHGRSSIWSMSLACVLVSSFACPFHQNLVFRPSATATASSCVTPKPSPFILPDFHLFHTFHCYCLLLPGNCSGNSTVLSLYIMTTTSIKKIINIRNIAIVKTLYFLPDPFKSLHWFCLPPHQTQAFCPPLGIQFLSCHLI